MLLRNGLLTNVLPLSLLGMAWQNFVHDSAVMNQSNAEGFTKLSSYSSGLYPPHCMIPPRTAGRMVSHDQVTGSGTISSATAWAVKLAQASISGNGELTAVGGLIVQLIADITGSGEVSNADIQAFLSATADLTGSGEISDADLEGLGALIAALTGNGTAADSILTGIGELGAALVVTGTGLTTSNVGQAVLEAAALSPISANIKKVNDYTVTGDGTSGTEWGPA